MLRCETAARNDECDIAVGQSYGDSSADGRSRTGWEFDRFGCGEICASIPWMGVDRDFASCNENVNGICHVLRVVQNNGALESLVE